MVLGEGWPWGPRGVVEEVVRVQRPVPQKLVRAAVKGVRTALGREADDAAREAAEFGAQVVRLHAEFGDGVL